MKKTLLIITAILCFAVAGNASTHLKKVRPEKVGICSKRLTLADSIIYEAINDGSIPGAVLAVVRGDKLAYLKAYGNRQVVPGIEPMTTDTQFDLASLSKCIGTTLSFMTLIDDGRVRLTDNVKQYIPGFKPWNKVDITIQDLLTHSSGLPAYTNVKKCAQRFGSPCPDSLMMHIAKELPRNFEPGHGFTYSCLNFVTLQNVLQNITGERLCDYAQTHVFDKLGLENTCYYPKDRAIPAKKLAKIAPTEVQENGLPYRGEVHDPIANILNDGNSGNAGVFSTAEDLAVIAAAIMNGGEYKGKRFLSPNMVKTMTTVPHEGYDWYLGRALGWDCWSSYAGNRGDLFSRMHTIGHTGYTGTSMIIDLDNKVSVILLTNRVHPKDDGGLGRTRATLANVIASAIIN